MREEMIPYRDPRFAVKFSTLPMGSPQIFYEGNDGSGLSRFSVIKVRSADSQTRFIGECFSSFCHPGDPSIKISIQSVRQRFWLETAMQRTRASSRLGPFLFWVRKSKICKFLN